MFVFVKLGDRVYVPYQGVSINLPSDDLPVTSHTAKQDHTNERGALGPPDRKDVM